MGTHTDANPTHAWHFALMSGHEMSRYTMAALGLFVALAAGLALTREVLPFEGLGTTPAQRFSALSRALSTTPLSSTGQFDILKTCHDTGISTYARVQPSPSRKRFLVACERDALEIARTNPASGFAWALAAGNAAELGDGAAFNAYLAKAFGTAQHEQWLAEFRVDLVERHRILATAGTRGLERADIRTLVATGKGIGSIARRYVEHPEFRDRVTAVVEHMNQTDQRRFVARVRSAARAFEGGR